MTRIAIGLGANLGDRLATLREAASRVAGVAPILARSRVWETAPVGGPEQPDYLNAALLVEWSGDPLALLDALMEIEAELGRVRGVVNGPRTIDLDVLWIDGVVVDERRLVVPHPRLRVRAFALAPMLEVAPGAIDPRDGAVLTAPYDADVRALSYEL
ncbi:MAG: 2-amino-4-hydroxy-6-hydroxymethyldihydropteridine diphosphokinase [Labilithrix sp.]|nr:2-amino-4-hydroxy-6-hydroxymethyldihydropteridine diphosphokinase [Labilithrix sp.]